MARKRRSDRRTPRTAEISGAERDLEFFDSLHAAVIDSSSLIYCTKAGVLDELARSVELVTVAGVYAETGYEELPVRRIDAEGESVDDQVIALAAALRLPVVTEDRKMMLKLEERELPFLNTLMVLNFLLYRRVIGLDRHSEAFELLLTVSRYSPRVFAYSREVFMEVARRL